MNNFSIDRLRKMNGNITVGDLGNKYTLNNNTEYEKLKELENGNYILFQKVRGVYIVLYEFQSAYINGDKAVIDYSCTACGYNPQSKTEYVQRTMHHNGCCVDKIVYDRLIKLTDKKYQSLKEKFTNLDNVRKRIMEIASTSDINFPTENSFRLSDFAIENFVNIDILPSSTTINEILEDFDAVKKEKCDFLKNLEGKWIMSTDMLKTYFAKVCDYSHNDLGKAELSYQMIGFNNNAWEEVATSCETSSLSNTWNIIGEQKKLDELYKLFVWHFRSLLDYVNMQFETKS